MKLPPIHLGPRQVWLLAVGSLALATMILSESVLYPAYEQWRRTQDLFEVRSEEYGRLMANLSVRKQIMGHFDRLPPEAIQNDTDETTVSGFLRELETKSRQANLLLNSMRPLTVKKAKSLRIYPVKLAVSGNLADVAGFLAGVAAGPAVTGVEGFSIRGIHGSQTVECQLSVWMVRLVGVQASAGATSRATLPASTERAHDKQQ